MTALLIKILGTLHGLFALWVLLVLPAAFSSGAFSELPIAQAAIKLITTVAGAAFLFLCMWASWRLSESSFLYAWLALGAFILGAFSDTVALRGLTGLFDLMPAFYVAVLIRALAAAVLTALVLSLHGRTVGA